MQFFSNWRKLFLFTFLFLLTGNWRSVADNADVRDAGWYQTVDSLKQLLNQPISERQKLKICQDILTKYNGREQDTVIIYTKKARDIALKLNDEEALRELYLALGVACSFTSNYDSAYFYLDKARELAIKQGNKEKETRTNSVIAFAYAKEGKYNTAIDYFLKTLKMAEDRNEWERYVMILSNLSEINRRLGNTEAAIQYLKQAEEKCNQNKFGDNWNMAHIFNEYAYNYLEEGNLDESLRYALKADSVERVMNAVAPVNPVNKCYTQGLLATVYLQRNDFDSALQYAQESYRQADILKDKNLYANAGKILSDIYMAQKRYPEAEAEALKIWMADSTMIDESRDAAENLVLANIYMDHTEKAAYYFKKYSDLNTQYSKKSFQNTVSDLSIKYETEKKEMQISSLEQQKTLYIIIGITGVMFAIVTGIVLWQRSKRERLKKQLIAANAVLEWEEKERKRFANELHDGINSMLSAIRMDLNTTESHIQNVGEKLDECIETIRRMAHGMMPASLEHCGMRAALEDFCRQFPNVHFHFFGEDRRVENKAELAIYYSAYELVNNSVKHSGAKNINVQLIQGDKHVSLTVHDDGCGFNREEVLQGSGLKSISNRVYSCNGKLDIISSPGNGTETIIELSAKNR